MERSILVTLNFDLTICSSYRFLERFAKIAKAKPMTFHLAQYLIELTLLEHRMLLYSPSLIAAAALNLALQILYREMSRWTPML